MMVVVVHVGKFQLRGCAILLWYNQVPVRTISYEIVRQLLNNSIKDYEYLSGFHFFQIVFIWLDWAFELRIWIEWQLCSFKLLMKCFFLKIYFDRSSRLSYRMTWMFGWVILYSSRPSCTSCTTGGPAVVTCHQLSILFYFWIRRSWIVTVRVSRRLLSSRMRTSTTWF